MLHLLRFPAAGWFLLTLKTCDTPHTGRDGCSADLRKYEETITLLWLCIILKHPNFLPLFFKEQEVLNNLFEKYVHSSIDMIVDGIVDGKQGQKLKTVVPQTDLNMVG